MRSFPTRASGIPPRLLTCVFAATAICFALTDVAPAQDAAQSQSDAQPSGRKDNPEAELSRSDLQALVRQLGSDRYSLREEARKALLRAGPAAVDVLYEIQDHDDVEIQFAVETLLQAINTRYADANSSEEAIQLTKDFAKLPEAEQRQRLSRMTALEPEEVIVILSRIARFDPGERTSRRAALYLLQTPTDRIKPARIAELLSDSLQQSPRTAATWLLAYRDSLLGGGDGLARIEALAAEELHQIRKFPDNPDNDREVVAELTRWLAARNLQFGKRERAFELYAELLSIVDGDPVELLANVGWLAGNEGWDLILETETRFPGQFARNAVLLYYIALAHQELDSPEKSTRYREQALAVSGDSSRNHWSVAATLQERGLKQWAEVEYRRTIELTEPGDPVHFYSQVYLADMIADQGEYGRGAEVLQDSIDAILEDPELFERLQDSITRDLNSIISRYYYLHATDLTEKKLYAEAAAMLKKCMSHDPNDLDALIAMFLLPEQNDEWKRETDQQIRASLGKLRDERELAEQDYVEQAGDGGQHGKELAAANNQFAWLACNTIGDFEEALECSHKSLVLMPDTSSYLDTLAHCYYALDDFENAVKYQSRAVEIDKYEMILHRKLDLFKRALKAGKKIPGEF